MIGWLTTKLAERTKVSETVSRAIVLAVVVCLSVLLCVGLKACYDNRVISKHETEVKAEVLEKTVVANDKAAEQRSKDTILNTKKEEARKDVISKTIDEKPSAPAVALGCERLRQSGYDTSRIPACG